ncbi:unnamed protein product [Gongylonema pulchrum]|uniref:G_PROTEIN_RECEP_F1_2 domain-containing protein n=1 Tax=Gongylonema pulchrum TaxID=637853 RepID=A0A183E6F2_9BILA|nr:unnamed protein product [Gongylonema pulchrum]
MHEQQQELQLQVQQHCLLDKDEELDERWISRKLSDACNCSDLRDFNILINLHCEAFPFSHETHVQIFYITIFTAIIVLAVCDATISIFNTGFSWTYNFYYIWIFGPTYCAFNNLMGIAPICASVFTMIAMSIDRFHFI